MAGCSSEKAFCRSRSSVGCWFLGDAETRQHGLRMGPKPQIQVQRAHLESDFPKPSAQRRARIELPFLRGQQHRIQFPFPLQFLKVCIDIPDRESAYPNAVAQGPVVEKHHRPKRQCSRAQQEARQSFAFEVGSEDGDPPEVARAARPWIVCRNRRSEDLTIAVRPKLKATYSNSTPREYSFTEKYSAVQAMALTPVEPASGSISCSSEEFPGPVIGPEKHSAQGVAEHDHRDGEKRIAILRSGNRQIKANRKRGHQSDRGDHGIEKNGDARAQRRHPAPQSPQAADGRDQTAPGRKAEWREIMPNMVANTTNNAMANSGRGR